MVNLEFFINLWTETVLPTFSRMIEIFTTPFSTLVNENLNIPIIGWIIEQILNLFPEVTLLEFILGTAVILVIIVAIIKFFIGLITGG